MRLAGFMDRTNRTANPMSATYFLSPTNVRLWTQLGHLRRNATKQNAPVDAGAFRIAATCQRSILRDDRSTKPIVQADQHRLEIILVGKEVRIWKGATRATVVRIT